MLEVVDLSKRYGPAQALDGCSFACAPGLVIGLLGPNGAGKTTLMRCLLGLVEPDGGTMRWRGAPITEQARRGFGYMPEERGLYPSMTVREQVIYFARLSGLARSAAGRAGRAVIDRVGLAELAGHRVEQLSHGNQQRVQLAIALVHEPELLVLDEPFAGLDPLGVDALGRLLRELADKGATVLFSSHQLDLVQHLCEDVVIVDHGRAVLAGPLERLQAATGRRHIDIVFARPPTARWFADVPGVDVAKANDRHARLTVGATVDLGEVLHAAQAAGPLIRFDFEPPTLEEMFREATAR